MADFNNPKNTNPLLSLFGYVRDGFTSLAKMFDGTTDSNVPVGAKKIDGSTKVVSQWNGSSWDVIGKVKEFLTSDFASGTIVTTVGATGADDKIPSEQAVREAISASAASFAANFTPTFYTATGYVLGVGSWTHVNKVGRLVTWAGRFNFSTLPTANGGGNSIVLDLPFAAISPGSFSGTSGSGLTLDVGSSILVLSQTYTGLGTSVWASFNVTYFSAS
jgi:hypothetical protein